MNCRPGDTCYIAGLDPALNLNGRFVTLAKAPPYQLAGYTFWRFTKPVVWTAPRHVHGLNGAQFAPGQRVLFCELPDQHLRLMRDAGPDAVDETLVRVGAPNYGEVTT